MTNPISKEPDFCIIGAGSAGFDAATAGAALGLSVTVVERQSAPRPSTNRAISLAVLREAAGLNAIGGFTKDAFADVRARLAAALAEAAPDRRLIRLAAMNVAVMHGSARFADPRTLLVGDQRLRPRRIVLATGSTPAPSANPALDALPAFMPDELDRITELPAHLVVAGSCATALSIAQSFRRLGSRVTVLVAGPLLGDIDPELSTPVLQALRREGVVFAGLGTIAEAEVRDGGLAISLADGRRLVASHLLRCAPEGPALDGLDLLAGGIASAGGNLQLSAALRSTNPRVYAIGAVTGHAGAAQAQIGVVLRSAIFKLPARVRPELVPRMVETDPPIATVGLSAGDVGPGEAFRIYRWPFAETDAGRATGRADGHVKIVADRRGRVLGAGIVGGAAREMIPFWTLAISQHLTLAQIGAVPAPPASFAEASRRAAVTHVASQLSGPWIKRALNLLGRLGP